MLTNSNPIVILMADDDPDDCMLTQDALEEARLLNEFHYVADGVELLDYLLRRNKYASFANKPLPGLILLDLNMPRMDGREALAEIKAHPDLRRIPVIVLTTSRAEEDVFRTYDLGANSYISKPVTFDALVEIMHTLALYWLQVVRLPNE